jgi:hypothetical protein
VIFSQELPNRSDNNPSLEMGFFGVLQNCSSPSVSPGLLVLLTVKFTRLQIVNTTAELGKGNGNRAN